jgi:hypothetical protein
VRRAGREVDEREVASGLKFNKSGKPTPERSKSESYQRDQQKEKTSADHARSPTVLSRVTSGSFTLDFFQHLSGESVLYPTCWASSAGPFECTNCGGRLTGLYLLPDNECVTFGREATESNLPIHLRKWTTSRVNQW